MAQPPRLPEFDKEKFKDEPLFAAFWELIQPHLKLNARLADHGATASENLAAGWVDVPLTGTQTFPFTIQSPLASGQQPYGVFVAAVFANNNLRVTPGASGVFVEWVLTPEGAILIRNITGEIADITCTVRLLVLAR
jgi:hypothetical protein